MQSLEWKESYSVGVNTLDEQHKLLVSHLNTIYHIYNDPEKKEQTGVMINQLEEYALVHFKSEEDLFVKHKFYGLDQHAKEHRFYEQKIKEYHTRFDSTDNKVTVEMLEFLADWLTGHILGSDQDYRRYLNNCGVF
jgi:hemerythrin-like metal-binding protein